MSTQTTELFLLEDLEDDRTAGDLAERDRAALAAVGEWVRTFILRPHPDLGRAGSVCPFVPVAVERKRHWLAAEQLADHDTQHVVDLMNSYKRRLLEPPPTDGDTSLDVIVVVFTDLPAERAPALFSDVLQQIAVPSYVEDGIVFGPFYDGNPATAIYNPDFRPFQSPVPFLFVRHGVVSDWKFFLEQEEWFPLWARRFGESAVHSLADELRRLPWRAPRV